MHRWGPQHRSRGGHCTAATGHLPDGVLSPDAPWVRQGPPGGFSDLPGVTSCLSVPSGKWGQRCSSLSPSFPPSAHTVPVKMSSSLRALAVLPAPSAWIRVSLYVGRGEAGPGAPDVRSLKPAALPGTEPRLCLPLGARGSQTRCGGAGRRLAAVRRQGALERGPSLVCAVSAGRAPHSCSATPGGFLGAPACSRRHRGGTRPLPSPTRMTRSPRGALTGRMDEQERRVGPLPLAARLWHLSEPGFLLQK